MVKGQGHGSERRVLDPHQGEMREDDRAEQQVVLDDARDEVPRQHPRRQEHHLQPAAVADDQLRGRRAGVDGPHVADQAVQGGVDVLGYEARGVLDGHDELGLDEVVGPASDGGGEARREGVWGWMGEGSWWCWGQPRVARGRIVRLGWPGRADREVVGSLTGRGCFEGLKSRLVGVIEG